MKKGKEILVLFVVFTMSLMLFVGCGNNNTNQGKENDVSNKIETKKASEELLQFIWFSDGGEGDVMQGIIDDFTAETGISIQLVTVPYADLEARISNMIQGGEAPALARITNPAYFSDFALDISDIISTDEFVEVSRLRMVDSNDDIICLPVDVTANGIILNKDLADKYEVNYPKLGEEIWTWDEFIEEMSKFKDKEDIVYPGVFDFSPHRFSTLLYSYGASILNEEGTEVRVNSPQAIKALEMFVQLHNDGILDPSVWAGNGDPNTLFRSGQYGFHFAGNWMLEPYMEMDFEIAAAPVPVGEQRATTPGGKYIMAFEDSGQEEEAKQFLEYFNQIDVHNRFNCENLFLSAKAGVDIEYPKMNEQLKVFQDEIDNAPIIAAADWASPFQPIFEPELKLAVAEAVQGIKTSQEALDNVAEIIKNEIK